MNASRLLNVANQLPITNGTGSCSCCCCWSWANLVFLRTREGIVKILEIVIGLICQNLAIHSDLTYSVSLGSTYYSFLRTITCSTMTTSILLLTYCISSKSVHSVRQSLFEITFNGIVCFLYISSSCYLAFAVYTILYPVHKIKSLFQAYPETSLTYMSGFAGGIVYGYDCWLAYKKYRG